MNNYTVYYHRNKINNKYYIGITCQKVNQRWRSQGQGYKSQQKFYQAILKYGWENFDHIILYEHLTAEEAGLIEKRLIQQYDSIKNGYNVELGGNNNQHSDITKEKIKNAMTGKKHSKETIQLICEKKQLQAGKKVQCIETKKIYNSLGEAMRDTGIDKASIRRVCVGEQGVAGGYHWKFIGKNSNENRQAKEDKRKKAVMCITTNKKYESVSEAARDTNSDPSNIIKVCNGKYKTTNKLQWKWLE